MKQPKIHYLDNKEFICELQKYFELKKLNPGMGCPDEIRSSNLSNKELSEKFGIGVLSIKNIKNFHSWKVK